MSFYQTRTRINFHYPINFTLLVAVYTIKNAGVMSSIDLSLDNHIHSIYIKFVEILFICH